MILEKKMEFARVEVTIHIPGKTDHTHSISSRDAQAEAKQLQELRDNNTDDSIQPSPAKRRKTNAAETADGQEVAPSVVASSVADLAQGPGIDPTSRFSYVYTGKHDHGLLEQEATRRQSSKWSGLSDAVSHMKKHCDVHLTAVLEKVDSLASSSSSKIK